MHRYRWPSLRLFAWSALAWSTYQVVNVASQRSAAAGRPDIELPPFWDAIWSSAPWMIWWVIGTPFLYRLAQAVPLVQRRWPLAALFHVASAVSFAWLVTMAGLYITVPDEVVAQVPAPPIPLRWLVVDGFLASIVIVVAQVVTSAQHALERERAAAELALRNSELDEALTRAQLQTLRYRLQPHFLHNALNSIVGLVRRGDRDRAVATLIGVSELLRQVADEDGPPLVPLEREMTFVDRYLAVEQVRFGDRMETEIEVPAEARTALVPTLLLQPLVENAVRHGVGESTETTTVGVRVLADRGNGTSHVGYYDGSIQGSTDAPASRGRVVIEVWNDGPELDDTELATSPGVGLGLTLERLEHAFGDAGVFELVSESGRVISRVSFPWLERVDGTTGGRLNDGEGK